MSSITVGAVRNKFLLTRPMRDVTENHIYPRIMEVVSTHTPHAGRDNNCIDFTCSIVVSTHTPHAGRDEIQNTRLQKSMKFLLTRPMRDVTHIHY